MNTSLRLASFAALVTFSAVAAGAQTPSSQTTSSSSTPEETRPATTTFLRRHWVVVCADRGSAGARDVVGERVSARHELHPGLHQRRGLRRDVGGRDQRPRGALRLVPVRHADRSRRPAAVPPDQRDVRRLRRPLPARESGVDRQPRRRLVCRREDQPVVGVPAEPGRARRPRDRQDPDRRRGRWATGRARPTCWSMSSPARTWRRSWKCPGMRGTKGAAAPTASTLPGGAFRWGGGVGFPSRSPARLSLELNGLVPSSDTATRTAALVGVDGSIAPLVADTEKITRATVGLTVQAPKGFFVGGGLSWNAADAGAQPRLLGTQRNALRRLLGLAGAARVSPGRPGLCAAAAAPAAAPAAAAGRGAQPDGQSGLRPVHGRGGPDRPR